jgi:hypothetical protein
MDVYYRLLAVACNRRIRPVDPHYSNLLKHVPAGENHPIIIIKSSTILQVLKNYEKKCMMLRI